MKAVIYELCFPGKLEFVKPVVGEALKSLRFFAPALSDEDEDDFRLIFTELIINAVVHGNKNDGGKKVHISVRLNGENVECFVADEGSGFDHKKLLSGASDFDTFESEHGRGILLVCSLTENFRFNERGNEISFKRRIASKVN